MFDIDWNSHDSAGSSKLLACATAIDASSCATAASTTAGYSWKTGVLIVSRASFSSTMNALSKYIPR